MEYKKFINYDNKISLKFISHINIQSVENNEIYINGIYLFII